MTSTRQMTAFTSSISKSWATHLARLSSRCALPVLMKEMRSRMRGARTPALLFACTALAIMMAVVLLSIMPLGDLGDRGRAAAVGKALFICLALLEGVMLALITPALTAGSITQEREQGTLEALLLTPLSTRGILLGKLLSALSFAGYILLCVLPVTAVSFMLGGISPAQIAYTLALLLSTALLFGTIGLYYSARFRKTVTSVILTYLTCLLWLVLIPFLQQSLPYSRDGNADFLDAVVCWIALPALATMVLTRLYTKYSHRKPSRLFIILLCLCWVRINLPQVINRLIAANETSIIMGQIRHLLLTLPLLGMISLLYTRVTRRLLSWRTMIFLWVLLTIVSLDAIFWYVKLHLHFDDALYLLGNPGSALWQLLLNDNIGGWLEDYFAPITVLILLMVSWILFLLTERRLERQRGCRTVETVLHKH